MPDINSVSVTFENGVKREEYGPTRKASVSITAAVGENEDGAVILHQISTLALARVADLLVAPRPKTDAADDATVANLEAAVAGEPQAAPARRGRPPKVAPPSVSAPEAGEEARTGTAEAAATPPTPTETTSTASDADDWEASAPVITDEELLKATSARAAALGGDPANRQKIKDLIGTFSPGGDQVFKAQDIPAAQRQDYLTKLAALT